MPGEARWHTYLPLLQPSRRTSGRQVKDVRRRHNLSELGHEFRALSATAAAIDENDDGLLSVRSHLLRKKR
jgi:hypothetical protein